MVQYQLIPANEAPGLSLVTNPLDGSKTDLQQTAIHIKLSNRNIFNVTEPVKNF